MYRLDLNSLTNQRVLSGKDAGRTLLPNLIAALPTGESLIAVDLQGLDVVTASFFREAFRALRDYVHRSTGGKVVYVNATKDTLDEAEILADQLGDAFIFASLNKGVLSDGRVVGHLEDKQAVALRILAELGEADAKNVKQHSGEGTTTTAWNNRLATLARKGILVERSEGRTKYYKPIIRDLVYG